MALSNAVTETKLDALKRLLREEVALHQTLKEELHQESVQDGKVDGATLLRMQQRKYHTARQIQDLENNRIALVKELAKEWQEPADALTLRRISTRTGGKEGHPP